MSLSIGAVRKIPSPWILAVSDKAGFVKQNVMECRAGSLRFDAGRPDDLGPLFGVVHDKLAEIGGQVDKDRTAQVADPRLQLRIGEASVDLLVQLFHDFGGRVLG